MKNQIRFVPPHGGLYEVTQRCLLGRYLLKPSPRLNRIVTGVLAQAQQRYQMRIFAATFLSNHYHLLLWANDTLQLARFMNYLASNLAREIGRLHNWRGPFWHGPYRAILVADDEASQVARLRYLIANACKEKLVARPRDWPGLHAANLILQGPVHRGVWIDRTGLCLARRKCRRSPISLRDFTQDTTLRLSRLPCWKDRSWEEIRTRVRELVAGIVAESLASHRADGGRPLGRRAILRQNPHFVPAALETPPAPWIHSSSRSAREAFKTAYRQLIKAYRRASEQLRRGDRRVVFPGGTFPPGMPFVPHPAGAGP